MKINQLESLVPEALKATGNERALILCARARDLKDTQNFEDARQVLGEFWQDVGDRPKLDGLAANVQAEMLLLVGTLSGWLGSLRQTPGAQEIAKDLIFQSSTVFEELGLTEKVAEARVELGICYWRSGALDEARITFDDALLRLGDLQSEQRLRAILNKALVEQVSSRPYEALRLLSESEPLFAASSNHRLKGKFHGEFGILLKNIGSSGHSEEYFDRALMQFTAASIELEQSGQIRILAGVQNNLSLLFAQLERFEEAHEHLDRALSVVTKLNDKGSRAQFEDSRARVFLRQGRLEQAEKIASSAVKLVRVGEQQSLLAAALTTHAVALARLQRTSDALAALNDAIGVAAQVGDPETEGIACLTVIEELASTVSASELRNYFSRAESILRHTQNALIKARLGASARTVLNCEAPAPISPAESSAATPDNLTLEEQVLRYEGELIKHALDTSDGSVTRAARLLGVTHQGLAFILNGRQKNLLSSRKPAKRRRRSIIRYH
ncbi:MAG TPA: tetratricopeptide repeat protein [Pyrinomonadaceae bacterium]|nr:tetratricopeptide repeat protein [Pyrinomonadaceae bacterium]